MGINIHRLRKDVYKLDQEKEEFGSLLLDRQGVIVKTSLVGVGANVLLAAFKAAVGLGTHSIAVTLDAVNNLSDALSSVVTILGAKLGAKAPDQKHPLGYGRIEYLSSMLVAALVLYAGVTSLVESIKKIFNPVEVDYTVLSLLILAVGILAKLVLGAYVKKQGERVHSGALLASGADASFDALLSASVLGSALIYLFLGWSLEAYVGLVLSIFIVKAGVEMMTQTLDDIIGHKGNLDLRKEVQEVLTQAEEVQGAYDLLLFNYGPDNYYGSVHLELPDTMKVKDLDLLTRRLQGEVYKKTGVIMTGIGVYSQNTQDSDLTRMQKTIEEKILAHPWALQVHGFYLNREEKIISLDVVVDFSMDKKEAFKLLQEDVRELYPDYRVQIVPAF